MEKVSSNIKAPWVPAAPQAPAAGGFATCSLLFREGSPAPHALLRHLRCTNLYEVVPVQCCDLYNPSSCSARLIPPDRISSASLQASVSPALGCSQAVISRPGHRVSNGPLGVFTGPWCAGAQSNKEWMRTCCSISRTLNSCPLSFP